MIATLYLLAMAVLLVYGLHQTWLAWQFVRHDTLHPGPVPPPGTPPAAPSAWPRVTVQLPLYNERYVATRVLDAVAALRYPMDRLDIQVLDDSTDDTAELVAVRVAYWARRGRSVSHVRRPHREGFKAGALDNGLRFATGDLVAVFDADFLPPSDFLHQLVPRFDAPDIGLVQARWGHANAEASLLTQVQAAALDTHFVIEQGARNASGVFMHFNGTAGIWRRACIDDAGGWEGDTLTEDLDLSYRAQLCGWRFRFAADVEVPAQLPEDVGALRAQQFRWTKGMAEVARKLLGRFWRTDLPRQTRWAGALHLTSFLVFPAVVLASLTHVPLVAARAAGGGGGDLIFALLSLGLLAFAAVCATFVLTQRALYPDWPRRLRWLPAFLAGTLGLAINNTGGVIEAWLGIRSPFVRTPKARGGSGAAYRVRRLTPVVALEIAAALYAVWGLVRVVSLGVWVAVPFQALFAIGFGLIAVYDVAQVYTLRRNGVGTISAVAG